MNATFHLPPDLADELVAEGLASKYPTPSVKLSGTTMVSWGDAAAAAVILLSSGANLVAITDLHPPLGAVAEKIARWAKRDSGSRKYALLAIGPKGQIRLDLDDQPSTEAISALLETVYEED